MDVNNHPNNYGTIGQMTHGHLWSIDEIHKGYSWYLIIIFHILSELLSMIILIHWWRTLVIQIIRWDSWMWNHPVIWHHRFTPWPSHFCWIFQVKQVRPLRAEKRSAVRPKTVCRPSAPSLWQTWAGKSRGNGGKMDGKRWKHHGNDGKPWENQSKNVPEECLSHRNEVSGHQQNRLSIKGCGVVGGWFTITAPI